MKDDCLETFKSCEFVLARLHRMGPTAADDNTERIVREVQEEHCLFKAKSF